MAKHFIKVLLEVDVPIHIDDDATLQDVLAVLYDEVFHIDIKLDGGEEFEGTVVEWNLLEWKENVDEED